MSKKRRMILIAGLVMSMSAASAAAAVTLTGCNQNKVIEDVTGIYYDAANDCFIQLTGTDFTCSIAMDGTEKTGTYTYDGWNLTLTVGGTEVIATLDASTRELKVTYGGKVCALKIAEYKQLSFNTDGGSTVAAQTVIGGKKGERPADPTKRGCYFVDWYDSANFTNRFDFDAPVAQDTVAYARFVEIDANAKAYTVTLAAGEGATVSDATLTTINGKLYNLPVPTKSGAKFMGWWVSHFEDANKLTYKYNEQAIASDITLYAVWDTDLDGAPAVSVQSNGINWTASGVNNSYQVSIYDTEQHKVVDTKTGSNLYAYDFSSKAPGEYKIEIGLNGKTTTAYYNNKGLDRVSGFKWENFTLSFDEVANATGYSITVECGNADHIHTDVPLGGTSYDFSACDMRTGGIKFIVKASADGYASSESVYFVEKNLGAVTNVTVDVASETLVWDAVESATSYLVEVTNGNETKTYTTTDASYALKYLTGAISFKVQATAKGFNPSAKAEYSYTKETLAAPQNVALAQDVITWDEVAGASKYVVIVNGHEYETTTNSIAANEELFGGAFGTKYEIYVKAVTATGTGNSLNSDKLEITTDGQMGNVAYENRTVKWNGVLGAVKYGVKVNDGEEVVVSDANSAAVVLTKKGVNEISVRSYANDNTPSDWKKIEVTAFEVVLDSQGGYQIGELVEEFAYVYLATGDELTLPTSVLKTGYTFADWYDSAEGAAGGANKYGQSVQFTEDTVVYAYWNANKYNVTISPTGGILPDDVTVFEVTFGSTFDLSVPESESGMVAFGGWYTDTDGNGVMMTDGDGHSVINWNIANSNVTLYPKWVDMFKFVLTKDSTDNSDCYSVSALDLVQKVTRAKIPAAYDGIPVRIVEGNCFYGCYNLVTVEIPDTVTRVELGEYGYSAAGSAFASCYKLENINVYHVDGNRDATYFSVDGVLYRRTNANATTAEVCYCPKKNGATLYIAKTVGGMKGEDNVGTFDVTSIPVNALENCEFEKVVIPSSVTEVCTNAFAKCYSLANVVFLSDNGTSPEPLTIEKEAFLSCFRLETVTLPKRLASFTPTAFEGCSVLAKVFISDEEGVDGVGENYSSLNGLVCKTTKNANDTLVFCGRGVTGEDGTFTIPVGINIIDKYAFKGCNKITKLIIPGYVTEIKESAIVRHYLTEIEFQGDADSADLTIGDWAFCGADMTKSISDRGNNNVLTEVTLPANLTKLGEHAFAYCNKLTTVNVNCSRATIDYATGAFDNDYNNAFVTDVNLGKDCPMFEVAGVFGKAVKNVSVHADNPYYYSNDGVLYDKAVTTILYYPVEKEGDFTVPATVTTIGAKVFSGRSGLTGVVIHSGVTSIGESAFYNCGKLEYVTIQDGEDELEIGELAFANCQSSAFTTLTIPARVKKIGAKAFQNDKYLQTVTLNEGLEEIGDEAFEWCYGLTSITIPSTVTKMGVYNEKTGKLASMLVFNMYKDYSNDVSHLATINVAAGNTVFKAVEGVLYLLDGSDVTDLLCCAAGKTGVVTVPKTVTTIWTNAFRGTTGVEEVKFEEGYEGKLTIQTDAFSYSKIRKMNLPEGLTEVTQGMFKKCSTLEEIVIPWTVTTIGKEAFSECAKLETITFTPAPEGETEKPLTFADCTKNTSSGADGSTTSITYGCKSLKNLVLPARTTSIGNYAFSGYYYQYQSSSATKAYGALESITIPSGVTKVGDYAFYLNTNLKNVTFLDAENAEAGTLTIGQYAFNKTSIETLKLSNTIKSIGNYAFKSNNALEYAVNATTVTIPANVESIGSYAFQAWKKLTSVNFETGSKVATIGNYAFDGCSVLDAFGFDKLTQLTSIGTYAFQSCPTLCKTEEKVDLSKATGLTKIDNNAFSACSSIKEISLPASITTLGNNAFQNCKALNKVTFNTNAVKYDAEGNIIADDDTTTEVAKTEGHNKLATVGNYCFMNTALTRFDFPISDAAQIAIGTGYQFQGCSALTTISLSRSVKTITNLFAKCPSITEVIIAPDHENLKTSTDANLPFILNVAGDTIVYGYTAVPTTEGRVYTIPEGFTKIDARAFEGQSGIKKLNLPASLVEIGEYAFTNCRGLEELNFAPGGVLSKIGQYAFNNCMSLKSVTIPNSVTDIGDFAFNACISMKTLKVGTSASTAIANIGKQAFYGCLGLETVEVYGSPKFAGSYSSYGHTFAACTSLKDVTFYGTVDFMNTAYLFAYSGLQSITLSDDTTTFSAYMFKGCSNLKTMKVRKADGTVVGNDNEIRIPSAMVSVSQTYKSSPTATSVSTYGYVFQDCTSIEKVVLHGAVTTIYDHAFNGCTSLATVGYTDDTGAFVGETGKLILPESIIKIGQSAFRACAFKTVSLENVTYMANKVCAWYTDGATGTTTTSSIFQDNKQLETVIFPSTATKIATYMFDGCSALKTVKYYDATTQTYVGDNNVVNLWEGLDFIGTYAFQNSGIEKVVFPASLVNISDKAAGSNVTSASTTAGCQFMGCEQLTTVIFSDKSKVVGGKTFMDCPALTTIKYKNSTTGEIVGEDGVATLPSSMIILFQYAFSNTGITHLVLPEISTQKLSTYIFANCEKLETVDYGWSNATSASYMFSGCSALKTFNFKKNANNEEGAVNLAGWTTVGSSNGIAIGMFMDCTSIEKVILSKSTTAILVDKLFSGCSSLATVHTEGDDDEETGHNIEGVANLKNITSLNYYSSGSSSRYDTFKGCAFKEVYMPAVIHCTYGGTFSECAELEKVTISAKLPNITNYMFADCVKLTTIFTDGDSNNAEGVANLSKITRIANKETGNLTSTSYNAKESFKNCTSLTTVLLNSLTTAHYTSTVTDTYTFDGCSSLAKVVLGSGVTKIGEGVFRGTALEKVVIGADVVSIGKYAYSGCDKLAKFEVDAGNTAYKAVDGALYTADDVLVCFPAGNKGEFTMAENAAGMMEGALWGYNGATKTYTITPELIGDTKVANMTAMFANTGIEKIVIGEGIETIDTGAFMDINSVKEVVIPWTVTSIGKAAFARCEALEKITFAATPEGEEERPLTITNGGSTLTGTYPGAFGVCPSLKSVTLPARLTNTGSYTFIASGVETVTFTSSDNLTIGQYLFKACESLKTVNYYDSETKQIVGKAGDVTLPMAVKVDMYAFEGCTALAPETITINISTPDTAGALASGNYLFKDCTAIKNVTVKGNITKIANGMFRWCTGLESVVIESAITEIGSDTFEGCENLKSFTIPETVTKLGSNMLKDCTSLKSIVIPASVVDLAGYTSAVTYDSASSIFGGWTSEQTVTIKYNKMESLNWTGIWPKCGATIVLEYVGETTASGNNGGNGGNAA